jgi:hypothetical protein
MQISFKLDIDQLFGTEKLVFFCEKRFCCFLVLFAFAPWLINMNKNEQIQT